MNKLFLVVCLAFLTNHLYSQTADELYKQAKELTKAQNYSKSNALLDKAFKLDSTQVKYYELKGNNLFHMKKYQEAYNLLSRGVSLMPNNSEMYSTRGDFFIDINDWDHAIEDYTRAIKMSNVDTLKLHYYNGRSVAFMSKREFYSAYEDLMRGYAIDSTDKAILTNLGVVCDEVGRGDETMKYLFKILETDTTFGPAYANIGFKYQVMGEYEKSTEYFNKMIALMPNEGIPYCNRAYNKMKMGDLTGAMVDINKSLELYPTNPWAYKNKALIYIEQKKYKKACEELERAVELKYTELYGIEVKTLMEKYCDK